MHTRNIIFSLLSSSVVCWAVASAQQYSNCGSPKPEERETLACLGDKTTCTGNENGCCEGLVCEGFGFYKKCQEPPLCLKQWFDCSSGTPCCDELVCAVGHVEGHYECRRPEIGTRVVAIPPGGAHLMAKPTDPPTTPPKPRNVKTTKIDGQPVKKNIAVSSGDPHISTFDGLKYDCQAEGEVILAKSLVTQREVQARYVHLGPKIAISVAKGVAIQDEGDTPTVQITIADLKESIGNDMGDGCTLLFFVDGKQRDLKDGSGDPRVNVAVTQDFRQIKVKYNVSEMEVTVNYFKCRMNFAVSIPNTDPTVGILGTANGKVADEWTTLNGTVIPLPENRADHLRKPGYDFCSTYFCNRDATKSLFTYPEAGIDFDSYQRCDLPYGDTLDEFMENVPQWVLDACGKEMACILDVRNGDVEDAKALRAARVEYAKICNPSAGECDVSPCCNGLKCVDYGGTAGKVCNGNMTCAPEFGNCQKLGCCGDFTCVQLNDGSKQCRDLRVCQLEWMNCDDNNLCCQGMHCLDNKARGIKQCRKLPQCMKKWDDCSIVGCCGSLKCVDIGDGGKQCQEIPGCWKQQWKDCSVTPCCDGLTCIKKDGRDVCAKLPECVSLGQSCEWSPCCNNDKRGPLQCVDVQDDQGRQGKQCRLVPGFADVLVFNDINANGILDPNEPGIQGVKLTVIRESDAVNVTDVLTSDDNGKIKFKNIPRGIPLRVKVIEGARGAIPTLQNRGGDESKDSDLRSDGTTDSFRLQAGIDTWADTALGFLMAQTVEVKVFNDLNSNGIQDEGETGIKDVKLRLVTQNLDDLPNQENGGNAHEELTTDVNGIVSFTQIPQRMRLRVKVTEAPGGAIPTQKSRGSNKEADSDLNSNGHTDEFQIQGSNSVFTSIDLGYRMPETVIVNVWDDANSNGIQDGGEKGLANVKLRLVNDDDNKTDFEDQKNGGNAHEILSTDSDGMVMFTKVPQNKRLRVKVVERPRGAISTNQNRGDDEEKDSDLNSEGFTDSFSLSSSGTAFASIDLGFRMPNSVVVRVWDDANGNGIQDTDEKGIAGVKLQLVRDDDAKSPLPNQMNGGNAHEEVATNADGFANFGLVPQSVRLRVKVTNAPRGAVSTSQNRGSDEAADSDLGSNGLTDSFTLTSAGDFTTMDIGYKMPTEVVVFVWDDGNNNGLQDADELGIRDVELCLIRDSDRSNLNDQGDGGNAHTTITTDETGAARFIGVPKGQRFRVKVVNKPNGAVRTNQNRGSDESADSDLGSDGTSDSFDLGSFAGNSFSSIDLGYQMPRDVEVRVWDDVNANGMQDDGEIGITGVDLSLVLDDTARSAVPDQQNGGSAHAVLTTGADGVVTFTKVPKGTTLRVKVNNRPPGAITTNQNRGSDEGKDSDLGSNLLSDSFNLNSFAGSGAFGNIDLGFRMPNDVSIRVWDDINGNGMQDKGEPGIQGVRLQLVNNDANRTDVENIGAGSTAHSVLTTDADGSVTFVKVPKGRDLRVRVNNAPSGSVRTNQNRGSDESADSDLGADMTSDSFNLASFNAAGAFQTIDLGFRMPKTMVVRVWNDVNRNGVQDDGEAGIPGVALRLILDSTKANLPDQQNDGNAHTQVVTEADGRAMFTLVPQGVTLRVKVVQAPPNATVAGKDKGGNDQLDSDLNSDGTSNSFQLPSDATALFDNVDLGYVLK